MDSWTADTASPDVKFEASPAESFLSMPGDMYPPLFATPAAGATVNPLEMLTPHCSADDQELDDDESVLGLAVDFSDSPAPSSNSTATPDKKPSKKRKSWGQVLPEPKTNLPPR